MGKKENAISVNDWDEYVGDESEQTCVISYQNLPKELILAYVNEAYKNFYLNPLNIISLMLKIRRWGDFKRFLRGFLNFLDYWQNYGKKVIRGEGTLA
jgi:hypothetical protein